MHMCGLCEWVVVCIHVCTAWCVSVYIYLCGWKVSSCMCVSTLCRCVLAGIKVHDSDFIVYSGQVKE